MMESIMSYQKDPAINSLISNQVIFSNYLHLFILKKQPKPKFEGQCTYMTICKTCGTNSGRNESFREIELSISEGDTLENCLENYLKPEILAGDNQYFCSNCLCNQDASRSIYLRSLPPVSISF